MGDVCDGWSETSEAIELLMSIKHLIYIKGNHDEWTCKFLKMNMSSYQIQKEHASWLFHGGNAT